MTSQRARSSSLAIAAALLLGGCSKPEAAPHHPLAIIGIDGMEWSVLRPLLLEGKLPHMRGLIERGAAGQLFTIRPALSPVCWTSVATGTDPATHGILDFLVPAPGGGLGPPYTSNMRRGKALWNLATDYGLRTLCVGWWVTWPAEEIRGYMVAPYSSPQQVNVNWKGNLHPGVPDQTWPRDLFDSIWPLVAKYSDDPTDRATLAKLEEINRPFFGDVDRAAITEQERSLVAGTGLTAVADWNFGAVARHLLDRMKTEGAPPDLTMVYFGGPDVASHRFWRYRTPQEFEYPIPAESIAELKDTIERFYVDADSKIGRLLEALPPETNVIVCSDHGFHAVSPKAPPPEGWSGHHMDGPPGVVIAAGPDVRAVAASKALLDPASTAPPPNLGRLFEIAPVAMHLLGIPLSERLAVPTGGSLMKNVVAPELLAKRPASPTVYDHDEGFRPPQAPRVLDSETGGKGPDIADALKQLGYIGGDGTALGGKFVESLPPPPKKE